VCTNEMTPRERVKRALHHQEADRIPIDNNGIVSSLHEVAYRNLLDALGLTEDIVILDPVQRIALNSEQVLQALQVDTRYLYPNAPQGWSYQESPDGTWSDEFGSVYKRVEYYADCVRPPLKGKDLGEIKRYRFPDPTHPSRFAGLGQKAKELYETSDYALVSGAMICIDYLRWILRGLQDSVIDIIANPDITDYLLDAITEWMMAFGGRLLDEIGDYIEFFWVGDDWGAQGGPFYSPQDFRRIFKPRLRRLIGYLKSKTEAKCAYHCCGSVYWAIEDLIDVGVDILHPLQPTAAGNGDTGRIKREFGNRLAFHGATDNQGLFHQSIAKLSADTLLRIRDLSPGGGYIFSSGHNIQANMPADNIRELFRLGREYGRYPIEVQRIDRRIERLAAVTVGL